MLRKAPLAGSSFTWNQGKTLRGPSGMQSPAASQLIGEMQDTARVSPAPPPGRKGLLMARNRRGAGRPSARNTTTIAGRHGTPALPLCEAWRPGVFA
jgi:hypothetical protein